MELNAAYQRAKEYVNFLGDRRHWIGRLTERYIRQTQCTAALEEQGAVVELEQEDWRAEAMDDFAQLTQILVGIRWRGGAAISELMEILHSHEDCLASLRLLDLAESSVSDPCCAQIAKIPSLVRLDLRRTGISAAAIDRLCRLPCLEEIHIKGCRVSWLQLLRLKFRYKTITFHKNDRLVLDASPRTRFDNVLQWSLRH